MNVWLRHPELYLAAASISFIFFISLLSSTSSDVRLHGVDWSSPGPAVWYRETAICALHSDLF